MSSRQDADENFWNESEIKKNAVSNFQTGFQNCNEIKQKLDTIGANLKVESSIHFDDDLATIIDESDSLEEQGWENETLPKSARYGSGSQQNQLHPVSAFHVAKLEAEVQHLERSAKERLTIPELVLNIINDKFYSLENYRSREEKIAILDKAIEFNDGNAILRAILHLLKTTKPSIFYQELMKRNVAVDHYVHYLRMHNKFAELEDFLGMQSDTTNEAAILAYRVVLNKPNSESVIKHLQICLRNHFEKNPSLTTETGLISEHLALLERQLPIESADEKSEKSGSEIFVRYPRIMPLPHQSLIDTLYYCCLYHFTEKETHFASPESLRKLFSLSNKQFMYTLVVVLASQKSWKSLEQIVFTKSYLGGHKIKSDLNIERILQVLHQNGAPTEVLNKYLPHIENLEKRLEAAKMYKSHNIIIETLVRLKDRQGLIAIRGKYPPHSKEYSLADDALRRYDVKWKT